MAHRNWSVESVDKKLHQARIGNDVKESIQTLLVSEGMGFRVAGCKQVNTFSGFFQKYLAYRIKQLGPSLSFTFALKMVKNERKSEVGIRGDFKPIQCG